MTKKTATEIGKEFMDAINNFLWEPNDFAEVVCNEHRHLQQEAFNTFIRCMETWAKHTSWDARNEFAVTTSKRLMEVMDDIYRFPPRY